MKYLMLIYGNEEIWNGLEPGELREVIADVDAFNQALRDSGELVSVEGLISEPKAIRAADSVPVVTDGPYLEAKEYVGSFFLVDVDSEERALEIARSYPGLRFGRGGLEIWPVMGHAASDV